MGKAFLVTLMTVGGFMLSPLFFSETVGANRALPTGDCSVGGQGGSLSGVSAMHEIMQCADNSQFSAGTAKAYFCDPGIGAWAKASTSFDFTLPANTLLPDGGAPPAVGPDIQVIYPFGRFVYVTVGAACTGGTFPDGGPNPWDGGIISTLSRS